MTPCFYACSGPRAEGLVQQFGVLVRVGPLQVAFQNRGIPNGMKIGSVGVIVFARVAAKVAVRDAVAAFVGVRSGMQWHVQIADEMDNVADGVRAFVWIGLRIFEYGELFYDSLSDATGFAAETCEGTPGRPARDVNVMPGAVFQGVADVVRPGGAVGEEAGGKRAAIT